MASASTSTGYQVLREQLQGLRWRVGEPTYEQMGKLWPDRPAPMRGAVRVFAPSTIADNLNGHRRGMSFDFVRFFVLSCLAYAMDMGIELSSEDQRLDLWYQRWQAQRPARAAASATSLPTDAGLRLVMGGSGGPAASHGRASVGDNQTSVAGDGEQVAAATIGGGWSDAINHGIHRTRTLPRTSLR